MLIFKKLIFFTFFIFDKRASAFFSKTRGRSLSGYEQNIVAEIASFPKWYVTFFYDLSYDLQRKHCDRIQTKKSRFLTLRTHCARNNDGIVLKLNIHKGLYLRIIYSKFQDPRISESVFTVYNVTPGDLRIWSHSPYIGHYGDLIIDLRSILHKR